MTLRDGPAQGVYAVKRAPYFLRAVVTSPPDPKADVLDQITDQARDGETIYVYRRIGGVGQVHINRGRRGGSGFYVLADYEHLPDVDAELLMLGDNAAWQRWCSTHAPDGVAVMGGY